jgi:catabolite regulation protein CreA
MRSEKCDRLRSAQACEREIIGSVATRALTEDSVEMEFLTDDPVAQAVTCQRVTLEARAPRCDRYGCATAGRVNWT